MEYLDKHIQMQQMVLTFFIKDKFQQFLFQTVDGSLRYSLSLVPQVEEDITNYTCVARNKIGERKAIILLTGILYCLIFYKGWTFKYLKVFPLLI